MKNKFLRFLTSSLILTLIFSQLGSVNAISAENLSDWIVYTYDNTNGLPTSEANTVLQTSDGYVWIGSYGGLIRYDGISFHNYSEGGVFPSSGIRALFEDSKGRLWIGTNDMGVYYFENDQFFDVPFDDNMKFLSIRSFAEGKDGLIYVGATSGLAVVKEEKSDKDEKSGSEDKSGDNSKNSENAAVIAKLEYVDEAACSATVYSLAAGNDGSVWACMDDGIALIAKEGKIMSTFKSEDSLKAAVYCAGTDREGNVYLGTSKNYIYKVEVSDDSHTDSAYSFTEFVTEKTSTINDIKQDAEGRIWVAAINGVEYMDTEGKWHTPDGDLTASAGIVNFDYEGNIWVASSSKGVIHIVKGMFKSINATAGLSGVSVNDITVYKNGYYIGTDTGLIILDKNFKRVTNKLTEMIEGDRVRNILTDSKGNVWVGTYYSNGLVKLEADTGEIKVFREEQGLTDSHIRMILELSDGSIAVATSNGLNIIENDKVVKTYAKDDGLTNPIILCLCEGEDGTIYAGSDGYGLYAVKDGEVKHYGADEGLPSGVVLRIANDPDSGGLYISAGNSLFFWDKNEFRQFTNYVKSPGSVFDIQFGENDIWLMQSNGLNIINRNDLKNEENASVRIIGIPYGLTGTLNANTWNDFEDGYIFLSTTNGVSVLDIEDVNAGDPAIKVAVSNIEADSEVYPSPDKIEVDGSVTRLTFNFAPLSFTEKDIMVQYQLKGFDKEFTVLHNNNPMSASYTNLNGGEYEFCVQVLSSSGKDIIGSYSVTVTKRYQLWERPWFWVLMIVVVFACIVFAVISLLHAKTAALQKRQKEYRRIIDQSLRTFANIIDAKDRYTNGHSLRVAAYSLEIAKKLKVSEEDQERIYDIALLHDIGKIGIPDSILNKNGKLNEKEIETVRRHPSIGGQILKDFTSIPGISEGAKYHHERYDGKGYNEGLSGEDIPFFARIICVADCYDTMAGGRHYQEKKDQNAIKEELKRCSGTQFDPNVAKAMIELIDEGKAPINFEGNSFRSFFEGHE
ncbi:MAG: HD domain-containing protein [Ruminococcaceae bacterium]|nr:HD domain-containing protein [Oscillospiraceae bacterium]